MPRYFVDVSEGSKITADREGTDLPNLEAGRALAIRTLSEIVGEFLPGSSQMNFTAVIRDESGATPYQAQITLSDHWGDRER